MPGHQRRARAGRAAARGGRRGGRDRHRRDRAAPARRRAQALLRLAARAPARARRSATSSSTRAAPTRPVASAGAWPRSCAARRPRGRAASARAEPRPTCQLATEARGRAMSRRRCSDAARCWRVDPGTRGHSATAPPRTPGARARRATPARRRQRLSSWPASNCAAISAPPALRVTAADSSGRDAADRRAELQRDRGDVDLALVALDRAQRRVRDVLRATSCPCRAGA